MLAPDLLDAAHRLSDVGNRSLGGTKVDSLFPAAAECASHHGEAGEPLGDSQPQSRTAQRVDVSVVAAAELPEAGADGRQESGILNKEDPACAPRFSLASFRHERIAATLNGWLPQRAA
ncbi:MAG: hypothetical protein ACYDCS_09190 [Candidatus Dormibacteria bacterium]